ncbi:MAG: hypothetical protein M1812_002411 [Candelaria pacifica]|nr:MAG: hypothetical protein M1812_002411 [Candelaria pacifica]
MSEPGPTTEFLGRIAYEFSVLQPLIPTYLHLLVSALFPIYTGAHASLSRPSSAAQPERRISDGDDDENDELEDVDSGQKMEGLSPSDAIMFPLLAGTTLAGLYFLIKWLQDPALLNKLMNWYFSSFGIFAVGRLVSDALDVLTSFVFPVRWVSRGTLWQVSSRERTVVAKHDTGKVETKTSPLPGRLSIIPLLPSTRKSLWLLRSLITERWILRAHAHGRAFLRAKFGVLDMTGVVFGLLAVAYYNIVDKPWWLTNLMGFGFSYGALQLMSPTTFWTGTLILGALFFYDIYFVFYTPLMVTVATSLDIPIKLLFPRPATPRDDPSKPSLSMLGLGDVVLPGIMIGLALRFDLYMFYLRKQTKKMGLDKAESKIEKGIEERDGTNGLVRAKYQRAVGGWGERFWTSTTSVQTGKEFIEGGLFPKPYFHAALVGYVFGMLATLGVMQFFAHAQPALLYLVPGVLVSIWGTALFRGEVTEMWAFTEAVEDEDKKGEGKEKGVEKDSSKTSSENGADATKQDQESRTLEGEHNPVTETQAKSTTAAKPEVAQRKLREVFSLTITAPPLPSSTIAELFKEEPKDSKTPDTLEDELRQASEADLAPNDNGTPSRNSGRSSMRLRSAEKGERAEKRQKRG